MSEQAWLRRRWKLVLNVVTLAALALVAIASRKQLGQTISDLAQIHGWLLLLLLPIEALNYHAQARLYQRMFAIVGNRLDYKHLYKVALELNFVNHVFPSGGITGLSYFSLRLRAGAGLTAAKATAVHFMKLVLQFLSFELLIIFGLLALSVMGRVNNLVVLVAGSLSTLLLVGTAGFFYLVGSRSRINNFFNYVTRGLNRLIKIVRPKYPETIKIDQAKHLVDDFHDNYSQIKASYGELKIPFWYALLCNVTEVMAVYVVFAAYGHLVNIGAVILAYAIANFAGLVSVMPGGVGIYEALMATTLAAAGVPASLSLPVIVTYRVINTLIQIPPGYYLYQRALRRGQAPVGDHDNA
jgi:uncharacterized protein (TIRG00374 family)